MFALTFLMMSSFSTLQTQCSSSLSFEMKVFQLLLRKSIGILGYTMNRSNTSTTTLIFMVGMTSRCTALVCMQVNRRMQYFGLAFILVILILQGPAKSNPVLMKALRGSSKQYAGRFARRFAGRFARHYSKGLALSFLDVIQPLHKLCRQFSKLRLL